MRWIKRLLGISTPLEKKKNKLTSLHRDAMLSQRNGNLREYAEIIKKAQALEDEIMELINEGR
jgi:hypothetical protein